MTDLLKQFDQAMRVDNQLIRHEQYLAHLPAAHRAGKVPDETLAEHMDLVLRLAKQLSVQHGLSPVVDRLVGQLVANRPAVHQPLLAGYIVQLFVGAIAFHDFGKVNEHFQKERMRNAGFQGTYAELLKPAHGHSELSAYLFAVYHLERIELTLTHLPEEERVWLSAVALLFTNPILLHHSPRFEPPKSRIGRGQFMKSADKLKRYLAYYQFPAPLISEPYFESWEPIWESFTEDNELGFAILALLRLNFSLLTAADYLATSEYMNQAGMDDVGVLGGELREKLDLRENNRLFLSHLYYLPNVNL